MEQILFFSRLLKSIPNIKPKTGELVFSKISLHVLQYNYLNNGDVLKRSRFTLMLQ